MNIKTILAAVAVIAASAAALSSVSAQAMMHHDMTIKHGGGKRVAYDSKDKRYYSVAYAKAHGMHDKGGDPLFVVAMSILPKDAKESKAMHGAKM